MCDTLLQSKISPGTEVEARLISVREVFPGLSLGAPNCPDRSWRGAARPEFGCRPDLRHTVRVALSRVRLVGHATSVLTGVSGPHLDRERNFERGRVCARATHPSAGVGVPETGKQRRHSQRGALVRGALDQAGTNMAQPWAR